MDNSNYITVQGWMVNELHLKGNDLLVYAIIYGFSQSESQKFTGSIQYLADWCGATKNGIQKNLKSLVDRGLIEKETYEKNNIKYCEYKCRGIQLSCIPCNGVVRGIQLSCTNNKEDKQENNNIISKEIIRDESNQESEFFSKMYSDTDLLGNIRKTSATKKRGKSLYEKCVDLIQTYTDNFGLQTLLEDYLKMRLQIKDKPLQYENQFKGLLNKLNLLATDDKDKEKIVQYSLEKGYASFYELKNNFTASSQSNVRSDTMTEDDYDRLERQKIEREQTGKKVYF